MISLNDREPGKHTTASEYSELFLDKVKKLLEEFPVVDPAVCSACPSLPEKVERIRQACIVIQQELSEIEFMQSECMQSIFNNGRDDVVENILVTPPGDFLGAFNQMMSCRP